MLYNSRSVGERAASTDKKGWGLTGMRRPRIHRPGELYYLVGRSNGAKPLFRDLQDYDCLKATLAGAARQCRATIYAFCLEPSSFHLAVRISNVSTGQLMAFLGRHYVEAFHRRNGGRGALLVPHYRALLVDGEYLAELVRFIVWVSVRAGCADTVEDWQQSSHPAYMGSVGIPWVDGAAVLATFDPDIELARRKYAEFVRTPTSGFFARGFERGRHRKVHPHVRRPERGRTTAMIMPPLPRAGYRVLTSELSHRPAMEINASALCAAHCRAVAPAFAYRRRSGLHAAAVQPHRRGS